MMTKDDIIKFLYYLLDKIDPIFINEVDKSIKNLINKLSKYYK